MRDVVDSVKLGSKRREIQIKFVLREVSYCVSIRTYPSLLSAERLISTDYAKL